MREDQLGPAVDGAQVADLGVRRGAPDPGLLGVAQQRLARPRERDLFVVREVVDGRVRAAARPRPVAEQERQRLEHLGQAGHLHVMSLAPVAGAARIALSAAGGA